MSEFRLGQLVRVVDPRCLAYGRIAMVICSKQGGRSQVRFADLPRGVAASPDPTGFVSVFDDDELQAVEDPPVAGFYAVGEIYEQNGEREYSHYCLAHGAVGQLDRVTDAIAKDWYASGGEWSDSEDAYVFDDCTRTYPQQWRIIPLAEYIQFRQLLPDRTPTS